MKTRLFSIAVMATAVFFIGCGEITTNSGGGDESPVEVMSVDEMETPTTLAVKIDGMSCPAGCAGPIEKDCRKLAGMGKSEVNFDEGVGYFTFDASLLSEDDILECISSTNGGGIYTGTVVTEEVEVESDEATTEEALEVVKNEDEAQV
ncbi:MAG: heavy-metal-associated domain-containing protein [Flavobacteriales bacterium]